MYSCFYKRLSFLRKLPSKLKVNTFKFQQSTVAKVPISLTLSYFQKTYYSFEEDVISSLEAPVMKHVSVLSNFHIKCSKKARALFLVIWCITVFKHLHSFICYNWIYKLNWFCKHTEKIRTAKILFNDPELKFRYS